VIGLMFLVWGIKEREDVGQAIGGLFLLFFVPLFIVLITEGFG